MQTIAWLLQMLHCNRNPLHMLPADSGLDHDGNISAAWLPVNETRDRSAHESHPDYPDLHHVANFKLKD